MANENARFEFEGADQRETFQPRGGPNTETDRNIRHSSCSLNSTAKQPYFPNPQDGKKSLYWFIGKNFGIVNQ